MTLTVERQVRIDSPDGAVLTGDLAVPADAVALVVFAHGSGSSRHSPRNRMVAARLRERGLATLLVDLLTAVEERDDRHTGHLRFDIALLARRLGACAAWAQTIPEVAPLLISYFGASTGAAAALVAAAEDPGSVAAVVSRGGRADLAGEALARVQAPTLLIVGSRDDVVLDLNRRALTRLPPGSRLEIVPGATHLFEEPGALESVAGLTGEWFCAHVRRPLRGGRA